MRKIALFVLLLAAVAGAVQAQPPQVNPKCNVQYRCYYQNFPNPIVNGGVSIFNDCVWVRPDFLRGIEQFQVPYLTGWDNRKFVFAKPVPAGSAYFDYALYSWATDWEFTINPSGPQCKKAKVTFSGNRIDFSNCTDGHSRICATYW